jgi:transcriptional antiterminator RfaH
VSSSVESWSRVARQGWIAVNTHPHRERVAIENLERQSFKAYCPYLRRRIKHARKFQDVLRPIFPGYLFVRVDGSVSWRPIRSTFGVRSVVVSGDCPSFLSDDFIAGLKKREVDGAIARPEEAYSIGQDIRICGGPFDGLIGTIIEMDERQRLTVLMDLLNGRVRVTVDAHSSAAL